MNKIFIILYTITLLFAISSCAPDLEPQDQDGHWAQNDNKIVYVCYKKERVKRVKTIFFSRIGPYDREGEMLREICITDEGGTFRNQITDDQALDYDPHWSPDGERIVFVSFQFQSDENNLFIVNEDGTGLRRLITRQKSGFNSPKWSPDGNFIAFIEGFSGGDLHLISTDGTDVKRLTTLGEIIYYDWAPNGDEIVFDRSYLDDDGIFRNEIYKVEVPSGQLTQFTEYPLDASRPVWSPTGQYIACVSFGEIYLINAKNGEGNWLSNTGGLVRGLIWHPNGSIVAYTVSESSTSDIELYIQDINNQNIQSTTLGDVLEFSIRWSSDGQYILYEKAEDLNEDSFYEKKLWVVNIETGEQWSISNNVDQYVTQMTP
jgi:Tol biopolymer transport system component